jgi:hypothetical protein
MLNQRFAVVLLAIGVATSFAVAQQQRDSGEKPLTKFLQEREELLRTIVESTKNAYEQGSTSWESLVAAENALLDAQLDSATTTQERIAIREIQLRRAAEQEIKVRQLVEAGEVVPMELLASKVNRLDAQIALLREQQIE